MCDTFVATGDATRTGVTVFAKNSDREPNEAQMIQVIPAEDHSPGSTVACTYIHIPQVPHTHAVLLSKPFWIWGAEMGANEHGVTIGNEAIFSKLPASRKNALIGMDLLRLGLERSTSAAGAVRVMTELLETFGQGGNCGFSKTIAYHNSFIVADPREAWLLETVDRHWAAKKINGIYTISNGLTIGGEWDMASPDLVAYALRRKWAAKRENFHFLKCYSDFVYTPLSDCRSRRRRTQLLLENVAGNIDISSAAAILRDHDIRGKGERRPDVGLTGAGVCMHACFGPVRGSQTTGSMISYLHPDHPTHFLTGTSAPCTGIFKPLWTDIEPPDTGPTPTGVYDPHSLFWRHERFHRAVLEDFENRSTLFCREREAFEQEFFTKALKTAGRKRDERGKFSHACFQYAAALEDKWMVQVKQSRPNGKRGFLHKRAWEAFNRRAKLPT
ncbi:MAG: C69 family dipeptidase [Desulfobacterales bacterium]